MRLITLGSPQRLTQPTEVFIFLFRTRQVHTYSKNRVKLPRSDALDGHTDLSPLC